MIGWRTTGIEANRYSRTWFETFLDQIPTQATEAEVAFLGRVSPLPDYQRVLDICCGSGRHAVPLTANGYLVTGLDRDATALRHAEERLQGTDARFVQGDMRDLGHLPAPFDTALVMWQSFGYFDTDSNQQVLDQIARVLRRGGRLVLDLYHRGFFDAHPGTRSLESGGRVVEETKWMDGNRLHVTLDYGEGDCEAMEWELFYPEEIVARAKAAGFHPVTVCSQWQESVRPSPALPRMQVVLTT